MRSTILATLFLVSCSLQPAMAGDPGPCYSIQNADARTYCLARARGDASMCYAIQDSARRSECMAEVRK